jgi:hypothetical protein
MTYSQKQYSFKKLLAESIALAVIIAACYAATSFVLGRMIMEELNFSYFIILAFIGIFIVLGFIRINKHLQSQNQ